MLTMECRLAVSCHLAEQTCPVDSCSVTAHRFPETLIPTSFLQLELRGALETATVPSTYLTSEACFCVGSMVPEATRIIWIPTQLSARMSLLAATLEMLWEV